MGWAHCVRSSIVGLKETSTRKLVLFPGHTDISWKRSFKFLPSGLSETERICPYKTLSGLPQTFGCPKSSVYLNIIGIHRYPEFTWIHSHNLPVSMATIWWYTCGTYIYILKHALKFHLVGYLMISTILHDIALWLDWSPCC